MHRLLILALCVVLAGCGFQLRGTGDAATAWPESLARLHLAGSGLVPELERRLVPALRRAGAEMVTERDDATGWLEIVTFDEGEDLLALGVGSTLRDFQLSVRIDYVLATEDGSASRPGSVVTTRTVQSRPEEIAAVMAETRRVKRELREEAIDALVRRLAASG